MAAYTLGRTVWHDEASRLWPAAWHRLRTVQHAHQGPVLDQGQVGSCTGNALAQVLNCAPFVEKRGRLLAESDALRIYSEATKLDPYPGTYPPEDTGSSGLAVCKAAKGEGLIGPYRHAFGLQHALRAIAGSPVLAGVGWRQSMFSPAPDGRLTVEGDAVGGHEVALIGLDVDARTVTVLNSWSESWGVQGRAYLSWDDLGTLLDDGGDVTVPAVA